MIYIPNSTYIQQYIYSIVYTHFSLYFIYNNTLLLTSISISNTTALRTSNCVKEFDAMCLVALVREHKLHLKASLNGC